MANVLQFSGIVSALYTMMHKWFSGLRGGLAIGTVATCTLLAAMTGIGATGVVTMGLTAYPEMTKRGYDKSIAIGCIPPAGALGPLIPPSALMIIIGGLSALSVGRLFIGGVFPGLIMSGFFIAYIIVICWRKPHLAPALPPEERATWREKLVSLREVVLPMLLIVGVLGSIYTGAATPIEAGGVGALGALICAAIYRTLNWKNIREAIHSTLRVTCMVLWLLIGGASFASFLCASGVSHFIAEVFIGIPSPMVVVIIMMIIALIMGMFMDGSAITMICIPIFMPIVRELGVDPLWFALLFTINMIIGYVTPPFGMNLFYLKGLVPPDITMMDIYRSVLPFVVVMVITLILCFVFPDILTWLPAKMIG
jgi:tripartite ATP-independent transporter DctM subunit